jgi:hypothetical protein
MPHLRHGEPAGDPLQDHLLELPNDRAELRGSRVGFVERYAATLNCG